MWIPGLRRRINRDCYVVVFTLTLGSRKLQAREGRILKLLSGLMMGGLGAVLVFAPGLLDRLWTAAALLLGATT